jgi:hypothetical protein
MSLPHILVIVTLALALILLVRRGLVHVDMSLPWMVGLVVLGFFSTSKSFVGWIAAALGILYPPIAILFITIFVLLGLIMSLLVGYSRLRERQIKIVRRLAKLELEHAIERP